VKALSWPRLLVALEVAQRRRPEASSDEIAREVAAQFRLEIDPSDGGIILPGWRVWIHDTDASWWQAGENPMRDVAEILRHHNGPARASWYREKIVCFDGEFELVRWADGYYQK